MAEDRPSAHARLAAWRAAGQAHDFRGHGIYFREDPGPPGAPVLTLIHGFPTASFDWHLLWKPLAARFRLVALDLFGFGFSAKPRAGPYSIATQADVVESLWAALGIRASHLLAHDYGDTVAQELLARHHDRQVAGDEGTRIASACLLNGGLFPETHRPRLIQKALATLAGPLVARLTTRASFGRSFGSVFGAATQPDARELDEFWALVSERDGQLVFPRLIGYIEERRRHRERWVGALMGDIPVRFIDGLDDPVSGAQMVARYRELIAHPDVVELAGIGHYPQCEAPRAVLEAVLAFHDGATLIPAALLDDEASKK